MAYTTANIAGAVSQADADNQRARLSDLQLRQGEQNLAQGSRVADLQLESAQMDMQAKKRGEALKQIEISGKLAEQVLASGGKNYPDFVSAMQQLGVPTDKLPPQYDPATMQSFVDKSKAFLTSEYESVEGPRGALLQREKRTGKLNQIVAPQARKDWEDPAYIEAQRKIAQARVEGKPAKLPTPALKMQQEETDAIAIASGIGSDLDAIKNQVDSGQLNLGLFKNLVSKGRNISGISDETSRNFATFQATLEKLRNDSLRLNKGVQTEGDSVRAWNELLANINDPKLVSKRLEEIKLINERAVNNRKMNIDNIRQNFGVEPLDTSGYEKQKPIIPSQPSRITNDAEYNSLPSGTTFVGPDGVTRRKP